MAVLDAWAYGLPVITTPVGGLTDVLKHRENALTFQPGNIEQLAKLLGKLMESDALRTKLAKSSKQLTHTIFTIKSISNELSNLYENI